MADANVSAVRLTLDGADLADKIDPRFIELSLSEKRDGSADELTLTLHNADGKMAMPAPGKVITLALGWASGTDVAVGLVEKGRFTVDEVEASGPPDVIRITARSADLNGNYRKRRTQSWKDTTVGAVLGEIASRHGISAQVHPDLAGKPIAALDQHGKSDMLLVKDLGSRYDAVATWKDRKLIFMPVGSATTAGGKTLAAKTLTKRDGWSWRFTRVQRDEYTRKFVDRARKEGWEATAAQVRPDGEGTKLDWNDLLLRHVSWKDEGRKAPLSDEMIDEYLWNGEVTLAKTARDKAMLIHEHKALGSFDFRHGNRLWWCKIRYDEENKPHRDVDEIANCAFRLLYRERDEIADETNYFLQIDFPEAQPTVKARFTASACANSGEFKKRLMAFAGMWSGSGEQLDRLMRNQTRSLKVVEPIPFTGYSAAHGAWLLGDMAVRQGRTVKLNSENYFDFGKQAVKLRSAERILDIEYDADKIAFEWVADLWTAYGPKGLIALAFFTMSFFAVQIREKQKSLGFLEITGLPGSGKTTLIEFLWKTTGRSGYEGFDPNKGTVAFLARNLMKVANLPVGLIEGGRDDDKGKGYKQFDYNELLVLYNGRSPRGTGQRSGGFETSEPPFLGSIYLMQNERIDAIPAVLERLMSMDIDKSRWSPATKVAAQRLENWPIEEVSGTIVHVIRNEAAYLKFYFERFAHHDQDMAKRVEGLTNTRPIKCHSQLAAGVEALSYLFPSVRPEWIAETLQVVDAMALDRQNSCGGDHPTVSDFWDKVQYLLEREKLDDHAEGKSVNQHRDRESHIAVNLVDFEARCRNAGIAPPNMDQLKKLLRNSKSRKWIATKNVNNPAGRVLSCWVFDQPKKAERII